MKKKSEYLRYVATILVTGVMGCLFAACSEMDDTYEDFIKDGQIIYPGKADSVRVHPGRERLKLSWLASPDPKVAYAKIYWNNQTDSVKVPLQEASSQDTIVVPFEGLAEGSYVFEIFTFDVKGNRSVKTEVLAKVYGETYEKQLLSRPVDKAEFDNGVLKLDWGTVPDTTAIGSEIVYVDKDGAEQTLFVPKTATTTEISGFITPQTIRDRTLYVPHEFAIDTFYTEYFPHVIKGPPPPPMFLDRTKWTITASSEDVAKGRVAANLIDGDLGSMFVNNLQDGLTYPHSITVDMGEVVPDIEGFYFYQRSLNPTKTVEVQTSMDGETWESQGIFTLASTSGEPVLLELPGAGTFRYFKHIYMDDYGNSNNVNIMELGTYSRPIPPIHLDKSNWTITASSEDESGGRVATNLIDGDIENLWVNELNAGLDYPHTITVDMGEQVSDIKGFYFYQRGMNNTKTVEVLTSMDGANWESRGQFIIPNIAGGIPVYIEFPDRLSFRHFKHVYLDSHVEGKQNINLREMGTFARPEE